MASAVDDEDHPGIAMDVNLKAAFFLCRAAATAMIEASRGPYPHLLAGRVDGRVGEAVATRI